MRPILLFFTHLRILWHRNARNFILLLLEITLSVLYLSAFISTLFAEYNYKIGYLEPDELRGYAILSVHADIANRMFMDETKEAYASFITSVKECPSVLDAGMTYDRQVNLDGLPVSHVSYDDCMDSFRQPTRHGNWPTAGECVIGGRVAELYGIGDECVLDGIAYRVADILTEPYFAVDSGIGGSLNIMNVLRAPGDVVLTVNEEKPEHVFGSLVVRFDPGATALESLKQELEPFGTVSSVDELIGRSSALRLNLVRGNLQMILVLVLISLLIAASAFLITSENTRRDHSILLLLGEGKGRMIGFLLLSHGFLLFCGWLFGILLSVRFAPFLTQGGQIVPEATAFTALYVGFLFFVHAVGIVLLCGKDALTSYRNHP